MYKWTLQEYTDMTKVIRMLYGVEEARRFFEKNFEEMTKLELKALQKLTARDNMQVTSENNTKAS